MLYTITVAGIVHAGVVASLAESALALIKLRAIQAVITGSAIGLRLCHTLVSSFITHPVITLIT
jgi:acyl-coenzyme A thioesterase PaaI-like protein